MKFKSEISEIKDKSQEIQYISERGDNKYSNHTTTAKFYVGWSTVDETKVGKFILNLATITDSLRKLTTNDIAFEWLEELEGCILSFKNMSD